MDLITQAVFGATTFAVVRGRGVATKEVFWGAAMGALPDMDVLTMPFLGPVEALLDTARGPILFLLPPHWPQF
jgi:inner membrane protein